MAILFSPYFRATDQENIPIPGAFLGFYATQTSTLQPIYADVNLTIPLKNPLPSDGNGVFPAIWLNDTLQPYKTVLQYPSVTDPTVPGAIVSGPNGTLDPYNTKTALDINAINQLQNRQTAAELAAGVVPTNYAYRPGNAQRYGVDPTGVLDSTIAMQQWVNACWSMYFYVDAQGVWSGGGAAVPILVLPPGKFKVSGTVYLPNGITLRGTGHPAHTVSHTRIILDSTGHTPARRWSANTIMGALSNTQPTVANNHFYQYSGGVTGGTEPIWPTNGSTVGDGTGTWTDQGLCTTGDNRNNPIFAFGRGSLPRSSSPQPPFGSTLVNSGCTSTIQEIEFWCVTLGVSTFSNPLAGTGIPIGDYPNGGHIYVDVDLADFDIIDCVFQHSPAAIRVKNLGLTTALRADGFNGNRGAGFFVDRCEFDAAAAHIWAQSSYLYVRFTNCEIFGGLHKYEGCTGTLVYEGGLMFGNSQIDGFSVANGLTSLTFNNVYAEPGSTPLIKWDNSAAVAGSGVVNVSNCTVPTAHGSSCFELYNFNAGKVNNNCINNSGYNASPGAGTSTYTAAIKLVDCQNLSVQGNNVTATDLTGSYNNMGIYSASLNRTSQGNFVNANAVSAPYNGGTVSGQDRFINLAPGDIWGLNFDAHGTSGTAMQRSISASVGAVASGTYTVGAFDHDLTFSVACVVTLPAVATSASRELYVRVTTAGTVTSASSNVVPLAGGAAGTAILAATAGKWARLMCDGTAWNIVSAN